MGEARTIRRVAFPFAHGAAGAGAVVGVALLGAFGLMACDQPPSQATLETFDTVGVIATRTPTERSVLFRLEDGREVRGRHARRRRSMGIRRRPGDLLLAGGGAFSTTIPEPPVGEPYDGNGYFCLDRSGTVTGYVD